MAVTLADIKKLRDMTGAGMMDVKKALEEANGDFEVAKDLLRKRGQAIAAKRSDREASEGCVLAKAGGGFGCIVAVIWLGYSLEVQPEPFEQDIVAVVQ